MARVLLALLPIAWMAAAWVVGRWLLALSRNGERPHGEAVFVGLAAVLVPLSLASFTGLAGTATAGWAVLLLLALGVVFGRKTWRVADRRELLATALVPLLAYLHFLWPLAAHPGTDVVLFYAGDYHQYVALASWLQDHPITSPAEMGEAFNTLQMNVFDHQLNKLRIGALLLMSLLTRASGAGVPQVYSIYCGFLVGLLALAVTLLARRLAPALPVWAAALAGLLFGLSPTATWAAYAAFIPQTLGLAFLVAALACAATLLAADRLAMDRTWRATALRSLPVGLLLFAAWSCYPEAVAPGALIVLLFLPLSLGRRLVERAVLGGLLRTCTCVAAVWILASPANFLWGWEGLAIQARSLAHGGEQNANAWSLFAMVVGAIQQPLVRTVGKFDGGWADILSLAICALALAGLVYAVVARSRALPLAVLATAGVLFAYVLRRYGVPPDAPEDAHTRLTWNLFKAASFIAPFVFAVAVTGVLALARRAWPVRGTPLAAGVLAAALAVIALRQDVLGAREMTLVRIDPEIRALVAQAPPGRLLLDVYRGDGALDYYQRFSAYAEAASRRFLSTRDWYPSQLEEPISPARDVLVEPLAYVLTDRPSDYPFLPVATRAGSFVLLDARGRDFRLDLRDFDGAPQTLLNLGRTGAARALTAEVYNLRPGRVLVAGASQIRGVAVTGAQVEQIPLAVPAEGGLRQLIIDPRPPGRAEIFLRDAAQPPAPALDLKPQLQAGAISADPNGARMTAEVAGGAVRLSMDRKGTSRAQVKLELEPGEYLMHLELGEVRIDERAAGGFGAFFGPDNDFAGSIELQPLAHRHHYLRVTSNRRQTVFFALGLGGWGAARGSMEVRTLELVRKVPAGAGKA